MSRVVIAAVSAAVLFLVLNAATTHAAGLPEQYAGTKWGVLITSEDEPTVSTFEHGLADLKALLGDQMGDALEPEHVSSGSSTEQATSTGLAYYLGTENVPAFTDGHRHYALKGGLLVSWASVTPAPPPSATILAPLPVGEQVVASPTDPRSYLYATYPGLAPVLDAIIRCESGWNPRAKNPVGTAAGLAQFLSTTWAGTPQGRAGISVYDPISNIDAAAWLYRQSGAWPWLASNGCHRLIR